jgi:hypothetical protein
LSIQEHTERTHKMHFPHRKDRIIVKMPGGNP